MKVRTKRTRDEMIYDGARVARWICSQIESGRCPSIKMACVEHSTNKRSLLRSIDAFIDSPPAGMSLQVQTVENWLRSHQTSRKERKAVARLTREIIENNSDWGPMGIADIAEAVAVEPAALYRWYRDMEGPSRPMPPRSIAKPSPITHAKELGVVEIMEQLTRHRNEVFEQRRQRIQQRLSELRAAI